MATPRRITNSFARSERLLEGYRAVGLSLLEYEQTTSGLGYIYALSQHNPQGPLPLDIKSFFSRSIHQFEAGVSFVPVEFLSAYLEDLMDLSIKEEDLFIQTKRKISSSIWVALIGLSFSLGAGLYIASLGASLIFSFALTMILSMPFALILHLSPRGQLSRRIRFAKLIQNEISRRRGDTGPFVATPLGGVVGGKIFGKATIGSARNMLLSRQCNWLH